MMSGFLLVDGATTSAHHSIAIPAPPDSPKLKVLNKATPVDFTYTPELHIAFCPIFVHSF